MSSDIKVTWQFMEKGWSLFAGAWDFLDGKKTKIGTAFFVVGTYWMGLEHVIQATASWREFVPKFCLYTASFLGVGAAIHTKVKANKVEGEGN